MTSSRLGFQLSGILPIEKRIIFRLRMTVFEAPNNIAPQYISDMLYIKSSIYKRLTRYTVNNDLWVPDVKLRTSGKPFPYSGVKAYNDLSVEIKNQRNL